jgi:hypothetical protein
MSDEAEQRLVDTDGDIDRQPPWHRTGAQSRRSDALAVEDTAHVGHLVLLVCGLAVLDDPHLETFDLGEAQSVVEFGVIVGVAVSVDECSWLVIDRGQHRSPCQGRNEAAIRVR